MRIFDYLSVRHYINYIGGTIRWAIGTTWSNIRGSKKYSYQEYIYGPNDSDDFIIDGLGHQMINRVIGMIVIVALGLFLSTIHI